MSDPGFVCMPKSEYNPSEVLPSYSESQALSSYSESQALPTYQQSQDYHKINQINTKTKQALIQKLQNRLIDPNTSIENKNRYTTQLDNLLRKSVNGGTRTTYKSKTYKHHKPKIYKPKTYKRKTYKRRKPKTYKRRKY